MSGFPHVSIDGPLAEFAAGFAGELASLGYSPRGGEAQLRLMQHVSRWLAGQGHGVGDLTEEMVDRFVAAPAEAVPVFAVSPGDGGAAGLVVAAGPAGGHRRPGACPPAASHRGRAGLAGGGGLVEVGQLLRHATSAATGIYSKVDIAGLAVLARPWHHTARLTPTPHAWPNKLCRRAGRNLTSSEWTFYVGQSHTGACAPNFPPAKALTRPHPR